MPQKVAIHVPEKITAKLKAPVPACHLSPPTYGKSQIGSSNHTACYYRIIEH